MAVAAHLASTTRTRLTPSQLGILARERSGALPHEFVVAEFLSLQATPEIGTPFATNVSVENVVDAVTAVLSDVPGLGLDARGALDGYDQDLNLGPVAPLVKVVTVLSTELLSTAREIYSSPLTLSDYPLFEAHVLHTAEQPNEIGVLFKAHHLVLDGYSMHLLFTRLLDCLGSRQQSSGQPVNADFLGDEDSSARAQTLTAHSEWDNRAEHNWVRDKLAWKTHPYLADLDEVGVSLLPSDHPASDLFDATLSTTHPLGMVTRLELGTLTVTETQIQTLLMGGNTWADLCLASHAILLARYTGAARVAISLPLSNRFSPAQLNVVTSAVNTAPLVISVNPQRGVSALMDEVRSALKFTRKHGNYPMEQLLRDRKLIGSPADLMGSEANLLAFAAFPELPGVRVKRTRIAQGPSQDVSFNFEPAPGGIAVSVVAPGNTDFAHLQGISHWFAEIFTTLRDALTVGPSSTTDSTSALPDFSHEVPLAVLFETAAVAEFRDNEKPESNPASIDDIWGQLTLLSPEHVCLRNSSQTWTVRAINQLATELSELVAGSPLPVINMLALEVPDRLDMAAAYLAGLVHHMTVVPLDPASPETRREAMLQHLGNPLSLESVRPLAIRNVVQSQPATVPAKVPAATPDLPPAVPTEPPAAYVVHTSGSTGAPKPVAVSRAALESMVDFHLETWLDAPEPLRVALTLPLTFDASLDSLIPAMVGHEVIVVDSETSRDPVALHQVFLAERIQVMDLPPSICAHFMTLPPLADLRLISIGGEATNASLWQELVEWAGPTRRIRNLYGPTECTVNSTWDHSPNSRDAASCAPSSTRLRGAGIGVPVTGIVTSVRDQWMLPVPPGIEGELYIGGSQLAHGYIGMPGRTASAFVAADNGERCYRSGDLVVQVAEASTPEFRFLRRRDNQVKIRGHRVELGEIERAARNHPAVNQAVAVMKSRLFLVVTTHSGAVATKAKIAPVNPVNEAIPVEHLAEHLADRLPSYMLPSQIIVAAKIPLTNHGKTDHAGLSALCAGSGAEKIPGQEPQNGRERAVAVAVASALGLDADAELPSRDADFFSLGGDSITAIQVCAHLRQAGHALSVRQLFAQRTVTAMAGVINPVPASTVDPLPAAGNRPTPSALPGQFKAREDRPLVSLGSAASAHLAKVLNRPNRTY